MTTFPLLLIAAGGLVIGLAVPAAARETGHLINGSSIKQHTIAGDRLKNNTLTGKQIKESTLREVPEAKTLPKLVWHRLTLDGGWVNFGTDVGDAAAGYAVDAQGFVHFRGAISGGGTGKAFSLPHSVVPSFACWGTTLVGTTATAGTLLIRSDVAYPTDGSSPSGSASQGTVLDTVILPPTC
ncbi:MAG TPA: hypothetical protein VHW92_13120 [Mycobacteriales bacterium]|nr:hypothetical protein [Mycobacteriales bacterium]